jgi:uncharacterized protein YecT (DUF1311 family)
MQMETGSARGELSRSVADELGEIFQPAPETAAEPAPARAQAVQPNARAGAGRAARFGGVAAAALAAVALGAVFLDTAPPRVVAAKDAPTVPLVVTEAPQPPPRADLPTPVFTPAETAEIATRPVTIKAAAKAPPARSKPKVVKARSAPAAGRCDRLSGDARARCAYPEVMAADRRLRRAYAQATRAGVERARLVSYRNRWASLRHRADDQPTRVIAAYGDMAQDLSRLAREARS